MNYNVIFCLADLQSETRQEPTTTVTEVPSHQERRWLRRSEINTPRRRIAPTQSELESPFPKSPQSLRNGTLRRRR